MIKNPLYLCLALSKAQIKEKNMTQSKLPATALHHSNPRNIVFSSLKLCYALHFFQHLTSKTHTPSNSTSINTPSPSFFHSFTHTWLWLWLECKEIEQHDRRLFQPTQHPFFIKQQLLFPSASECGNMHIPNSTMQLPHLSHSQLVQSPFLSLLNSFRCRYLFHYNFSQLLNPLLLRNTPRFKIHSPPQNQAQLELHARRVRTKLRRTRIAVLPRNLPQWQAPILPRRPSPRSNAAAEEARG